GASGLGGARGGGWSGVFAGMGGDGDLHFFPTRRSSDLTGRLNVDGMNIISNDGSNKLNRSRKARVSYKVQRTINASLNAATSTRAVSSNPNFVTRQKIEIIGSAMPRSESGSAGMPRPIS